MRSAPYPDNEEERMEALLRYKVLDTESETAYDDLVSLAAAICETPISLVSLVDSDRQWFKAKVGLNACETHRDLAFCAHAILGDDLFIVADTLKDERFADNPLVTDGPKIRFYAGAPLKTPDGYALGTLCVIDNKPHSISDTQRKALCTLAHQTVSQLELRLQTIRLKKMNEYKSRFLSMLSHDLRGAFNTVLGFSQMLSRRAEFLSPDDIVKYTKQINLSADSAYRQLNTVLEWSRFELGDFPFTPKQHYISDLCQAVIELVKTSAQQKSISIKLECHDNLLVEVDECMLMSILQNLLCNSIKFSSPESVVSLQVKPLAGELLLSVVDHGIGMPAEKAAGLFSKKHTASSEGTMGEAGSGIGNLLVREFVDLHKGSIDVSSESGRGTSVTVHLPQPSFGVFLTPHALNSSSSAGYTRNP